MKRSITYFLSSLFSLLYKNLFYSRKKIYFVTFYTEGGKIDKGIDLTYEVKNYLSLLSPFVDHCTKVSYNDLYQNDATRIYVKSFNEIAEYNQNTNYIGFFRFKPYIILKELEKVNEGDFVYYRDCNITKYPNILKGILSSRWLVHYCMRFAYDDVFCPTEWYPNLTIENVVKKEVLDYFEIKKDKYHNYLRNCSIVICRKSNKSIAFLKEWLNVCMSDSLLSPKYNPTIQLPLFHHNTQEQAIFNGLLNSKINDYLPSISIKDRKFRFKNLIKVPKVAILISGEMRNFDSEFINKNNNLNLIEKLNCDVFVSTWKHRGFSCAHGTAKEPVYSKYELNSEQIRLAYKKFNLCPKDIEIEDFDVWLTQLNDDLRSLYINGMQINDKLVKATSLPQLYKIFKSFQLMEKYEHKYNVKYDLVIRFRPDLCLLEPLPENVLYDLLSLKNLKKRVIYHMNPHKIYYPNRIYDIFFFGKRNDFKILSEAWNNFSLLVDDNFDNKLPKVDCCRLLYIQAIRNGIKVKEFNRCLGDIYRDEPIDDYINKIKNIFN